MAQIRLSTNVTPKTKTLRIGIRAKHLIETTDFNNVNYCALAKAVREQLNITDVVVDTYDVDFDHDGYTNSWRIVGRYTHDDFDADKQKAELTDDPETVIRYIKLVKE